MNDTAAAPPDPRLTRLAKSLEGRYEFDAILGRGGAGTVYLVRNRTLNREEALKVLTESSDPEYARRFVKEAKVAASLDHPRIVKIYDFGSFEDILWCSMQLVDGPTLAHILEGGIRMDQVSMARLAVPLLDALEYSHKRGIVHRDIKPANILVNVEGRPFISDFGIAKTDDTMQRTLTGQLMGTPAYVSPEQALGEPVDARTDLYSLGVTLYELLAGARPFIAESTLQTVVMRLNQPPDPILERCPALNPGIAEWLMKALARDRGERWESAAAMKEALVQVCESAGIAWGQPLAEKSVLRQLLPAKMRTRPLADLKPTTPLARHASGLRRRMPLLAAAGLLVALVAGSAVLRRRAAAEAPGAPATAGAPAAASPGPQETKAAAGPAPARPVPVAPAPAKPREPEPRRPLSMPVAEETPPPDLKATPECAGQTVALSLVVDATGRVKASRVLAACPPECARAAQEAAARWRFQPARDHEGNPVEATISVAVPFSE
jgi:serine/threonine-protein kinase